MERREFLIGLGVGLVVLPLARGLDSELGSPEYFEALDNGEYERLAVDFGLSFTPAATNSPLVLPLTDDYPKTKLLPLAGSLVYRPNYPQFNRGNREVQDFPTGEHRTEYEFQVGITDPTLLSILNRNSSFGIPGMATAEYVRLDDKLVTETFTFGTTHQFELSSQDTGALLAAVAQPVPPEYTATYSVNEGISRVMWREENRFCRIEAAPRGRVTRVNTYYE